MTDRAAVSLLERVIANYRGELLRADAAALRAIADLYAPVRARLASRVDALVAELAQSGRLSVADALRLDRARTLLAATEDELARLAPQVDGIAGQYRQIALRLGMDHAQGLTLVTAHRDGAGTLARVSAAWNRLNTGAVEQIVGRLTPQSPLRGVLDSLGGDAGARMAQALREQVALGTNPRAVAAALTRELDVPQARLLLVSRTEALGAYRGASAAAYEANGDILDGMVWTSAKSSRTCLACLSQDGTVYPLGSSIQRFHPACRCSLRPRLKGVDDDGAVPTGREWFYRQPVRDQLRMLPPSARDDFAAGRLDLADFVKVDHSAEWGDSHRVGSLAHARDRATARRASGTTLPKPPPAQPRAIRGGDDPDDLAIATERRAS